MRKRHASQIRRGICAGRKGAQVSIRRGLERRAFFRAWLSPAGECRATNEVGTCHLPTAHEPFRHLFTPARYRHNA